jgi:hypothetical protein
MTLGVVIASEPRERDDDSFSAGNLITVFLPLVLFMIPFIFIFRRVFGHMKKSNIVLDRNMDHMARMEEKTDRVVALLESIRNDLGRSEARRVAPAMCLTIGQRLGGSGISSPANIARRREARGATPSSSHVNCKVRAQMCMKRFHSWTKNQTRKDSEGAAGAVDLQSIGRPRDVAASPVEFGRGNGIKNPCTL